MIIDADKLDVPGGIIEGFDVCILGAGVVGITLARALSKQGLRIALLEGGGLEYSDESQDLYVVESIGLPHKDLAAMRLRYFGGTSGHWAGHSVEMDRYDFDAKPYAKDTGWPISRTAIEPYLAQAQGILDVNDKLGTAVKLPLLPNSFRQFRKPLSASTLPDYEGLPTRFGPKYQSEIKADRNISLFVRMNLVNMTLAESRTHMPSVDCVGLNSGRKFTVRANTFVLGLGGVETPRMLLNSTDQMPAGIGNDNGLVGRYFSSTFNAFIGNYVLNWDLVREKYRPVAEWNAEGIQRNRMYFVPTQDFMERNRILNFLLHVIPFDPDDREFEFSTGGIARKTLCWSDLTARLAKSFYGEIWKCDDQRYNGLIEILAEATPNYDSRVFLSDARDRFGLRKAKVDWRLSEFDYRTLRTALMELGRIFVAKDIGRVHMADWMAADDPSYFNADNHDAEVTTGYHQYGACRMAASPQKGVVDKNLKVFGIDNLYICGNSVFPSTGHANPTLTTVQLTLRLAAHLSASG